MQNLFFRNRFVFGVLMVCVLALGVQGIANSVTLEAISDIVQTSRIGESFEIKFSATLSSPKVKKSIYKSRKSGDPDYEADNVSYYDNTVFRTDWNKANTGTTLGTGIRWKKVNNVFYYFTVTDAGSDDDNSDRYTYTFYDSQGSTGGNDGSSLVEFAQNKLEKGTKISAVHDSTNTMTESVAYYFNDQAIVIDLDAPGGAAAGTLMRSGGYGVRNIDSATRLTNEEVPTATQASLYQRTLAPALRLTTGKNTITLTFTPGSDATNDIGNYRITVTDVTPTADFQADQTLVNPQPLVFMLNVTAGTISSNDLSVTTSNRRILTAEKTEPVHTRITFPNAENNRIHYQVTKGNGTLYVGTSQEEYTTPTQDLLTHQSSPVYINMKGTTNEVSVSYAGQDPRTDGVKVVFEYTGTGAPSGGGGGGDPPPASTNTITAPSSVSGAPGTTQSFTVSAGTAAVRVADASAFRSAGGTVSISGTSVSVTLPNSPGSTYPITFGASNYPDRNVSISVIARGTLAVRTVGARSGTQQQLTVTASGGTIPSGGLTVTLTGVTLPQTVTLPSSRSISRIFTLPSATSAHTIYASATGFTNSPSITIAAPTTTTTTTTDTTTTDTTTTTTTDDAPEPSRINPIGSTTRSDNTANQELDAPLIVQVLDGDGDGVEDVRVIFRVRTGQGRLQQLGNGRARAVQTDSQGYARADYTPMSASSTVEAEVRGVNRTVTFTITTGAATAATGTTGTVGATRTYKVGDPIPLSTGNTLSFSGSRRVNGTTYTCVGPGECVVSYGLVTRGEIRSATTPTVQAKAYKVGEKIPISLNDTLTFTSSHTVKGTTYTCVGPGECVVSHGLVAKGEIRVVAPTSATTPPRTREINPVVQVGAAQRPPMVWVDGGGIYALVGASVERFAPGVDNAQNIAVSGGKVYWTEQTGESAGTINSANLDGSNVQELAAILAVPMGIAVDTAGSKLYWTNSRGRIQSANLDGSRITNELQNLEGVMDLALAGGNAYWTQGGNVRFVNLKGQKQIRNVSTGTDTAGSLAIGGGKVYWTEQTGDSGGTVNSANLNGSGAKQLAAILATPTGIAVDGSRSKLYWGNARGRIQAANLDGSKIQNVVDGLGSPGDMVLSNSISAPVAGGTSARSGTTASNKYDVNGDGSVDSMDVDALVVAVSAGITDAKYDVNADGKVDINDVVAVSANRSAGAAGAPTLIGNIKLSAIQIDRLQEQIELLIATGDRSPAAMKTLIYLQQLIALARPEQTQLFANYPNPFNPETWIPYELAMDTNVTLTIYNAQGIVIRTLQLGQQSAGYYTDRERAAYWDGRNALGEQVASGVYFYQLETDAMSLMRKMVILK